MCLDSFLNAIPKILQCGHTICEICASLIHEKHSRNAIICPFCMNRTACLNPKALPTNFLAKKIAEQTKVNLEIEEKKKQLSLPLPTDIPFCETHQENCKIFCSSPFCLQLICGVCAALDHKTHEYDFIPKMYQTYRCIVVEKLFSAKSMLSRIEEDMGTVSEAIRTLEGERSQTELKIRNSINELRNMIDQRENALLDELQTKSANIQRKLENEHTVLRDLVITASNHIEEIENVIPQAISLLNNTKSFFDKIDHILSMKWNIHTTMPFITKMSNPVAFDYAASGLSDCELSLSTFGNIITKQNFEPVNYLTVTPDNVKIPSRVITFPDKFSDLNFVACIPESWWAENQQNGNNGDSKKKRHEGNVLVLTDPKRRALLTINQKTGEIHNFTPNTNKGSYFGGVSVFKNPVTQEILILAADFEGDRIQIFDAKTGRLVHQFSDPTFMKGCCGVAVAPRSGLFVVANLKSNSISIHKGYGAFNLNESVSSFSSMSFKSYYAVDVVKVIGLSKDISLKKPHGVAVNSKGQIIVTALDTHKIYIFDCVENGCNLLRTFGTSGKNAGYKHGQ
eukprot:TRINITY_DN88_c1_g1_i1.p1 TRINITY_DN88_c1_g1~~TRINITY_DN88_c1_g1_i1.p1  ORF type:complete len:568 (-),score=82.09 TRINITY_DN88_c1_g1_i1:4-1707(-)